MYAIGLIILLTLLIAWSLWLRTCRYRQMLDENKTKPSPVSLAVQELVATAGGIYLSLIMLVSFLKLEIPSKVGLLTVAIDPLALISLGVAIIQPLFLKLYLLLHK